MTISADNAKLTMEDLNRTTSVLNASNSIKLHILNKNQETLNSKIVSRNMPKKAQTSSKAKE